MAAPKKNVKPAVKGAENIAKAENAVFGAEAPKAEAKAPKTEEPKAEAKAPKTEEPKVEVKAVKTEASKAAAKKEAAPKAAKKPAAARKTVKKADQKVAIHVQFAGKSYSQEELIKMAQDVWKYDLKQKVRGLASIELYVKPEENKVYYVMNQEFTGDFNI